MGTRMADAAELARQVRDGGMSGIAFAEGGRTAYLSCGAAALAVPELDYTTAVALAFPRSPMTTAGIAWELAEASDGRFTLGLGSQVRAHIERRYSAAFDPPGPRMREYVLALRAIFRAFQGLEKLHFEGEYYTFTLFNSQWSPGRIAHPDIPIFISAVGPWMLRMAGEVCDGIHIHPFHSADYLNAVVLPKVAEGAATADRSVDDVKLAIPVFTIVGDTEEERAPWRDRARSQIAFYGSTKNYAFQFEMLGFDGVSARLNDRLKAGDLQGMSDLISDEMLEHYAVTATWDELADKLVDRYRGVADRLIMYFAQPQMERFPETSGRWGEVARAVRAAG
ncbi:MAG: TIGR03617 family F420-dependent LLM class oxidoreductase [Acidimicrobiales bacterium]